jgi:hypothetical protein
MRFEAVSATIFALVFQRLAIQLLLYFFFAEGIIFERQGRIPVIYRGREHVMQSELAREYISHDMHCLLSIIPVGITIENV